MYIYVLIVIGFVAVAYVGYSVVEAMYAGKARVRRRVAGLGASATPQSAEPEPEAPHIDDALPTVSKIITSRGFADNLMLLLARSGLKLRPSEFLGIASGIALGLGILAGLLLRNIGAEILAIVLGFAAPFVYVKSLEARRLVAFNRQLPDALALIGSAIRSGYSFQRAMLMASEEMPAPISEEFARVLNETKVGLSMEAALTRMATRVQSYDLELVVTAVIIQQQIGGNLAEIIENIATTIRERVRVEGELSALTAEGRISGIVLVVLPIGLAAIISVLNPTYLKPLIQESWGIWMIVGAVVLQLTGALVIKRMLVLDY